MSIKKINALRKLFLYIQNHLDIIDDPELVQVFKQKAYHYINYCSECLSDNTHTAREVAKINRAMVVFREFYLYVSPEPLVDAGEDYCEYEYSDSEENDYTYEIHKSQ